ncbi:hypothetical protein NXC24_PC01128 (plasmid) [Rhizobium sp. NXC24]|nr:hypothetical protein NXC24_PC01128 [Rhizobium sp. NXC24]
MASTSAKLHLASAFADPHYGAKMMLQIDGLWSLMGMPATGCFQESSLAAYKLR